MYAIALFDTESEEIVGHVYPIEKMNMDEFIDKLTNSWKMFQSVIDDKLDGEYSIEDFIEWHNYTHETKIDYLITDYIQL